MENLIIFITLLVLIMSFGAMTKIIIDCFNDKFRKPKPKGTANRYLYHPGNDNSQTFCPFSSDETYVLCENCRCGIELKDADDKTTGFVCGLMHW